MQVDCFPLLQLNVRIDNLSVSEWLDGFNATEFTRQHTHGGIVQSDNGHVFWLENNRFNALLIGGIPHQLYKLHISAATVSGAGNS